VIFPFVYSGLVVALALVLGGLILYVGIDLSRRQVGC